MEFVGVRNININSSENSEITFEVDEGNILKILNVTHSFQPFVNSPNPFIKLNNEYIYYSHRFSNDPVQLNISFPFYLNDGQHILEINTADNFEFQGTLYGLEFKLTTP